MKKQLLDQVLYSLDFRREEIEEIASRLVSCQPLSLIGLPRVGLARVLRFLLLHEELIEKKLKSPNFTLVEIDLNDLFSLNETCFWQLVLKRLVDECKYKKLSGDFDELYLSAVKARDSFTFFDNAKRVVAKICSQGYFLFFFFNRFDRALPLYNFQFFAHLQSLKDVAKIQTGMLSTLNRPIEQLSPEAFKGGNLEIFSLKYFLKPASKIDLENSVIKEYENTRKISLTPETKKIVYRYSGGHAQYALLILQAMEKTGFKTKNVDKYLRDDRTLWEQSKEIWEYLTKEEKEALLDNKSGQAKQFLTEIGLLKINGEIFNPLFKHFLETQKLLRETSGQELTQKEKALLTVLKSHEGELVNREDLINFVWPENPEEVNDWALDQLVKRLRKKIKTLRLSFQIKTIKTQGYKLN